MVRRPQPKQDFSGAIGALAGRNLSMIRLQPVCKGNALRFSDTTDGSADLALTVPATVVCAFCEAVGSSDLDGAALLVMKIESASGSLNFDVRPS